VGRSLEVVAVASHDTASAVVAIPNTGRDFAYISCGTWGLVGLELDAPVLGEDARRAQFTNEGGVDGTTRFLHNVMGLWLLSESLRHWEPAATDAQRSSLLRELLEDAARVTADVPVFDVNDPVFLPAGNIPERICSWYQSHGEWVPKNRDEVVRCIVESLAEAFAVAIRRACHLADQDVSVIHLVGGGSQNAMLCQATANRSGLRVVAGPTEATAIGNILIQARAVGQVPNDLSAVREIVIHSFNVVEYLPR
jgi:rhamnulokinase